MILELRAAVERPTLPTIPSSRTMAGRASGLLPNTQDIRRTSGNVFERPPAQQGHLQETHENSKNSASSPRRVKPEFTEHTMTTGSKVRPEQQGLHCAKTILHSGDGIPRHTGGTYSHDGIMDYARFPISEMHLGKFPDSMEFQSWKVSFKEEVCAKTANPQITMHWITEVEKARSIDELSTSQSIQGRQDFPDYEMLDVLIASSLKKLLNPHVHFRERVSVEEQRAQNTTDSDEEDRLRI